jgi:predicted dehydrogenase
LHIETSVDLKVAMIRHGLNIALIGGGRWARVHAQVLSSLYPRVSRLIWVSHYYRSSALKVAAQFPPDLDVQYVDSIEALELSSLDAAVVCTSSANHADNAISLLTSGLPVFVEKPLALDERTALEVVNTASRRNLALWVCLPLLKASYLRLFKAAWHGRKITQIVIHWFDPAREERHGEIKQADINTNKVDEIVPHLWSILNVLLDVNEFTVFSVAAKPSGTAVATMWSNDIRIEMNFGRRAPARIRHIDLAFADGGTAVLDFSREPGEASVDDHRCQVDGSWELGQRPLAAMITEFLDNLTPATNPEAIQNSAQQALQSVRLSETIKTILFAREATLAAELYLAGKNQDNSELLDLMIDNLGPELALSGKRMDTMDLEMHRTTVRTALDLLNQDSEPSSFSAPSLGNETLGALKASLFLRQARHAVGKQRRP